MTKKLILIIDDDKLLRDSLGYLFTEKGHEVALANNSENGLLEISKAKPDIILLDILLPGKDGLQTIQEICHIDKSLCDHIIMLTSLDDYKYLAKALEHGVSNYITKNTTTPKAIVDLVENKLKGFEAKS